MKNKVELIIKTIIDIDTDHYPDCYTISDAINKQKKLFDEDGTAIEIFDMVDNYTVELKEIK